MYYYHQNHQTNSYKIANQKLDVEIKKIYDESKGRYGSPKIALLSIQLISFHPLFIKKIE